MHVQCRKTENEVWNKLKAAFGDSGLLRSLVEARLETFDSIEEYVNVIMASVQKLRGIIFEISEE